MQKYQPVRKSISGVTPRLDLSSSELSHEADVSNFYEAKNDIVEFNPLHGSTPRGTTPRGTTPVPPEATVAAAPSPVPVSQPAAQSALPTPLPSPSAAPEPTLTRQPSAADKLLSKYRRKSSFTLNKNAGPSATTTALGIAAKEELLKDVTAEPSSSSEVTPVPTPTASSAAATATDNTTLAAAAAAAAAKRSSLSSAFPVITDATEISSVPSPASPTANGSKITADAPTPKKRTSFFALQNGSSRDLKAVLEASVETNNKSVGEQEVPAQPASVDTVKSTEQVIPPVSVDIAPSLAVPVEPSPKPATSVIEVGTETDKKVTEEQKKSPSSTPTSAAAAGRSSFLSRYQPKKRSITGTSSNNLKADLQKEMSTTVVPEAASSEAAPIVSMETPAAQVELPPSHSSEQNVESPATSVNAPAKVEEIEPVTVEIVAQSESTVPSVTIPTKVAASDDILSSLPDIPQSISDQLPSTVPIPSQRTVPLPPPPEAESVIAILAAQSTTAHNQSLHSIASDIEVKVPFASSSVDELADVAGDAEPVVENTATVIEALQPADIPVSPEPSVSVAFAEDKPPTARGEISTTVTVSSSGPDVSLPLPEPVPEPESTPIVPTLQEETVPSTELPVSSTVVPVDPVPVPASPSAPLAPVTEQSAEGSATVSSATAAASTSAAPAPPAAHPDGFEVEYAGEKSSISSSVLMRQIAASKQNEENPEMQQHESEKTSHYSKLGSAFVTSNALGRGGRGGGRGRGRGL